MAPEFRTKYLSFRYAESQAAKFMISYCWLTDEPALNQLTDGDLVSEWVCRNTTDGWRFVINSAHRVTRRIQSWLMFGKWNSFAREIIEVLTNFNSREDQVQALAMDRILAKPRKNFFFVCFFFFYIVVFFY